MKSETNNNAGVVLLAVGAAVIVAAKVLKKPEPIKETVASKFNFQYQGPAAALTFKVALGHGTSVSDFMPTVQGQSNINISESRSGLQGRVASYDLNIKDLAPGKYDALASISLGNRTLAKDFDATAITIK